MIRLDFRRAASVRPVMDDDTPDSWTNTETLLIALGDELDAAVEMSASREAETLFAEIAKRCRKAAALAEAGHLLVARSGRN